MYLALEAAGYTRDKDIRVAGYDAAPHPGPWRFLHRTKAHRGHVPRQRRRPVISSATRTGRSTPSTSSPTRRSAWKNKYIHGFTPIAGNFPGQGVLYPLLFTGLNITDFPVPGHRRERPSRAPRCT